MVENIKEAFDSAEIFTALKYPDEFLKINFGDGNEDG